MLEDLQVGDILVFDNGEEGVALEVLRRDENRIDVDFKRNRNRTLRFIFGIATGKAIGTNYVVVKVIKHV